VHEAASPSPGPARSYGGPWSYVAAAAAVVATTAIGLAAFEHIDRADIAMLYLLAILVASLTGRGPSIVAASLSVAAFDLCFIPPRFTFAVAQPHHLLTFAVMFGAGLTISTLTGRLRRQEIGARLRERYTAALLAFTRDVRAADDAAETAIAAVHHIEDVLDVAAGVLVPDDKTGALAAAAGLMPQAAPELGVAHWAFDHREKAGHGTEVMADVPLLAVPLVAGHSAIGVVVVRPRRGGRFLDAEQQHLLDGFVQHAALAIGRSRLAAEARDATLRARTEALRSSLLSVVSHDLRTPLAVITGAATSLRDDGDRLAPTERADLLDTLVEEARRLERVVANLLSMTRVETGIEPSREWVPVEEVVGAALSRVEQLLGAREVRIEVPSELLVHVDPVLFAQVLINLLENAVKHGAPPIEITARRRDDGVEIEIVDHGPGIAAGDEDRVFEKFYRASAAPGVGLGLAVVRGIVSAHGGLIAAAAARDGARFRITLPVVAPPAPGLEAASEASP
jgi:two-component system, OmpR family, sensor histidine kinase KdpD